jgi:exopolyphosphatase / guanosine-5'-triphosphate,3'-diphosphate pyrophosphatase
MSQHFVDPSQFAAVDLGSNSFHLLVAKEVDHGFSTLDKVKDTVRLAEGLDSCNHLAPHACQRALTSLAKFQQRLRSVPLENIRVVGTSAFRRFEAPHTFINEAEATLGHSIEIISGREEARLIYLGANHSLAPNHQQRLIIDVGGGSTEMIIGNQQQPLMLESLDLGCVGIMRQCFADNKINDKNLNAAAILVGLELEPYIRPFRRLGWETVVGCSGSLQAIEQVMMEQRSGHGSIYRPELVTLIQSLKKQFPANDVRLPGLSAGRAPVFVGGCVIVLGIMELLQIDEISLTDGALREGIMIDLLGRAHHHDIRDLSIESLCQRFQVDHTQSEAVTQCAMKLYAAGQRVWRIENDTHSQLLRWACQTHELGMAISHSQHHHHGAAILAAADLPGFSRTDQLLLSALVKSHRRNLKQDFFNSLNATQLSTLQPLIALLRISVALNRGFAMTDLNVFQATVSEHKIQLEFVPHWLDSHPLTLEDLKLEMIQLEKIGIKLTLI